MRRHALVHDYVAPSYARIWTLNVPVQILELQASAGQYTHLDGPHGRIPVGAYKIGRIAQLRVPHLTNTVPLDPQISDQDWARVKGWWPSPDIRSRSATVWLG